MSVGPWAGAFSAATASTYMAKAEAQGRAHARRQADLLVAAMPKTPNVKPTPSKCACCGSHEFRKHAERMICTYCRTDGRQSTLTALYRVDTGESYE